MSDEQEGSEKEGVDSLKKLARSAVLIMLVTMIFIALVSFFFSMQAAKSSLFEPKYVPLLQAIFSLAVIAVGVYLVKMFISR